jgi:hypothetical protein
MENPDKSRILILPHSFLIKEYLKIAQDKEKLLDFYYKGLQVFDEITSHSEQNLGKFINENNKILSGRHAFIILQTKNAIDSFFIHHLALKNGLCNATVFNLRYCFETLIKNYFYLTRPVGEKDIERYKDCRFTDICNRLYGPLTLENNIKKLYEGLSIKSHAGIISSSPAFECSPDTYKDSLECGIFWLHGYFVFLLECFNQFISEEDRIKIHNFFWEFSKIFNNNSPSFIPDKDDIIPLLKFQNISLVNPDTLGEFKRDKQEYLDNSNSY